MLHARTRQRAFKSAAAELGLVAASVETDFSAAEELAATGALLDGDAPTAIVYSNDHMAIAGRRSAPARAVRSPVTSPITGYDDTEIRALRPIRPHQRRHRRPGSRPCRGRTLLGAIEGHDPR